VTYAAETRAETSKIKEILKTMEMRMLRIIRKISLRSEQIRQDYGIRDVIRWIVRARQ